MPIADLFSSSALSKQVGTSRSRRNSQHLRGIERFRPPNRLSELSEPGPVAWSTVPAVPTSSEPMSEPKKASIFNAVPTVPTVPTGKGNDADHCRGCGSRILWPVVGAGLIFADGTAECMACADREVGRLLAAGRRAVESPAALADEAEQMLQGELE